VQQPVALNAVVCASPNQVSARVGDEVAVLDLDLSVYYGLDPVAARIFELLQEPAALEDVLATVLDEFEVDLPTARADLLAFVDDLLDRKLAVVQAGDAP
jgi:hypothetical protein